jgi:diguanylate cyclase (GGDEF)-like protein/PAS domain S-box-containing protein
MTWNVVTLGRDAPLERATEVMATARISSVLVSDLGIPVGIVTERDILRALEAQVPKSAPVEKVMSAPLVGAPRDMALHDAYHFMSKKGVRHLLVTDEGDRAVGIVTESDFRFHLGLEFYRRLQDVRTVMSARMPVLPPTALVREAVSAMTARDANCTVVAIANKPVGMLTERDTVRIFRDDARCMDLPLAEIMSTPVETIPVGTHLHDAMERMQSERIRHLVVVDEAGKVAGILSEHDVVRQLETEYLDFALRDNRRTRKQLQESEMRRHAVFNQARQFMGLLDLDGTLRDANRSALELIGDPDPEEVIGKRFWDTPWWSHDPALQERLRRAFADVACGRSSRFEATHPAADGTLHYIDFQLHPILDQTGKLALAMAEGTDVTERHRIEEQRRLALRVFQSSHDAIMITDPRGIILDVNQAFTDLTGYARDEAVGRGASMLNSGHHDKEFFRQMFETLGREDHWLGELWNRTKSGEISVVLMTISAVRDNAGELTQYVGVFTDITQRKESERRLEHLAHHDALTNLPNRILFHDRLQQAVRNAERDQQPLALLFVDLDRFKEINDSLGHVAGDRLLVEAATRITASLRHSDTVARLGGDEFTVILQGIGDRSTAEAVAAGIIEALAAPYELLGRQVKVSASIGIAVYPEDADSPDHLVNAADQAMYDAKALGRSRYSFYAH